MNALITQLTRTGTIVTRPTTSVLKFRSPDQDPVEIAEQLNVDAILEGNFQRSGNRLRLTAQMLDSQSGKTLWAESFNTEIDDIFDVQDRIAERIVNAFSQRHSAETRAQLTKRYTENKAAYEEYLKGRVSFSKRTGEGLATALRHFEKAIEIDPSYALAYAGMAEAYQLLPLSDELEPHNAFPKAKAAVLRALEIDDSIAEAHVSLGVILMDFDWNWRGAELSFQKAIELNPNYAAAHQVYGTLLLRLGRIGDAILELKKAQLLDPMSPAINTWMGEAFANLGQHEAAIRIHQETVRMAPDYLFAYYFLVQSYVSTGQLAAAAKAAEDAVVLSDDMSLTRSASIFLKAHIGDREAARSELDGLIEKRSIKYVSAVNIASGFAVLGETDEVFKWLETAYVDRDSNLTWLNVDHEFDYLRSDERFRTLVRNVNLPDARTSQVAEAATPEVDAEPEKPAAVVERKGRSFAKIAGLAALTIAIFGSAGYFLFAPSTNRAVEKNILIQLTSDPLDDAHPKFTRDGRVRFLRYVEKNAVASFVMNGDGSDIRAGSSIPSLTSGLFSPDGGKVFFHKAAGDANFYLANVDGTDEKVMPFKPGNCLWSPDSSQLVFQARALDSSIANNSDIYIYTLATGEIRPVVESPFFDSDPAFSPDGKSIVYVSDVDGNFEVYSKVIATGETKRLTHNPGHDSFPSYSPDGTQITFNSDMEKENTDAYLMNADGSNLRKITDGPGWDAVPPDGWSPDGTQLLLLSDRNGHEHIYVMNIELNVPRQLAPNVESDHPLAPSYSPSGTEIVYQSPNEVRIFDTNSQADRMVIKTGLAGNPRFSPDAGKIMYLDRIDDNTEICTVNVDGSGFVNVSRNPSRDMTPAFSPDGKKIVFAANRAAGTTLFEIYEMNLDGSDPRLIYGDRAMSIAPVWSPDGKTIVFSNDSEGGRIGNFELYSIDVGGGVPIRLTNRPRYDTDAAYSPDGSKIAFTSNTDGNLEIYVMNADGSGLVRLTRDAGDDSAPQWSPDGKRLIFSSNRTGKYRIYEIEL